MINEIFLFEERLTPDTITDAVNNRRVVSIAYQGDKENAPGVRTIEPSCFGVDFKGRNVIRAWQRAGASVTGINPPPITKGWKWFIVDRISSWNESSNLNFTKKRPMFNTKGDKHMKKVYAISDFPTTVVSKLPRVFNRGKAPIKPKGTISTTVQPLGKEFQAREKTRDPKAKIQTFYPAGNKKVKVALSTKEYDDSFEGSKLIKALNTIIDKVKSKDKIVFLDLSGMAEDKIVAFANHKINVRESLNEQVDIWSYEYDFPMVKRMMTLTELLKFD